MSTLIDELYTRLQMGEAYQNSGYELSNGVIGWYISKPCEYCGFSTIVNRVKDAWRVLTGKSQAFHYFEDSKKSGIYR